MRTVSLILGLALMGVSGSAHAATTVLGGGMGEACYQGARDEISPRIGLEMCTDAIDKEAMNLRDLAATHVNRGIFRMRLKDGPGALADFDRASKLQPRMGDVYTNRGVLLITMNRDADAMTELNKALELGTEKPEIAHYGRAVLHELAGRFKEAYADYQKAVELAPKWQLPREQLQRFKVVPSAEAVAPVNG
jgi:tetratricopeptide (TPR) repeat protein